MKPGDLPPRAQARLSAIDAAWQDAMDLARNAAARRDRLQGAIAYDKWQPSESEHAELLRLGQQHARHQQRHMELHTLANNLHAFVARLSNKTALEEAPPPVWPVRDGESPQACVDRLRAEIGALQNHRSMAEHAPAPLADQKKLAAAFIAEMAQAGAPTISCSRDRITIDFLNPRDADAAMSFRDSLRVIAWLHSDLLVQKIGDMIDAMPVLGKPLSASARSRELANLDVQIEALERAEESVISALEEQGQTTIMRREEAAPACVLGIVIKRTAAAVAA